MFLTPGFMPLPMGASVGPLDTPQAMCTLTHALGVPRLSLERIAWGQEWWVKSWGKGWRTLSFGVSSEAEFWPSSEGSAVCPQ